MRSSYLAVECLSRGSMHVVVAERVVSVETPGEIGYRNVILRAVAAVCKVATAAVRGRCAPADGFSEQVLSAVGEAVNNITLHGYRDRPSDIIRARMRIDGGVLRLAIEDYGASFDPLSVRLPDLDALPESGLGIYIIRCLMDEVSYESGRPNVLSLAKRIC
jgi:serine/threonine-protein kinase RsbW